MVKKSLLALSAYAIASALLNYGIISRLLGIGGWSDIKSVWVFLFLMINMLFIPVFLTLLGMTWLKSKSILLKMEWPLLLALQAFFLFDFENRVHFMLVAMAAVFLVNAALLWRLMRKSPSKLFHMNPFGLIISGAVNA